MIKKILKYQPIIFQSRQSFSVRPKGDIEFHEHDSFLKVLLNKPKALNSLNLDMIRVLNSELSTMNKAKAVWF